MADELSPKIGDVEIRYMDNHVEEATQTAAGDYDFKQGCYVAKDEHGLFVVPLANVRYVRVVPVENAKRIYEDWQNAPDVDAVEKLRTKRMIGRRAYPR